jgi:para-aminobenzoate synthetase / 4-amino-4-deoxychorismate lyase
MKLREDAWHEPIARFDDMRAEGKGFELCDVVEVFSATKTHEVAEVITAAERAASDGYWVAGFVSYEAAPGLDPALAVIERAADDPLGGLPLAWFGVFSRRHRVTPPADPGPYRGRPWALDLTLSRYREEVEAIRRGISRGDFYQVNLTARMAGRESDAATRYASMVPSRC